MSEAAPEATPAQEQPATETDAPAAESKTDDTDWKAEARKWEQRAKENSQKAKEFEKAQQASMTEAERAVAEAESRGRTAATQEYGKRLAQSEIRAVAANAAADLAGVFDYLDLARFVGDDGEPDAKAIKAFVDALPRREPVNPPLDLGQRGAPSAPQDFNQTLRRAAGRA